MRRYGKVPAHLHGPRLIPVREQQEAAITRGLLPTTQNHGWLREAVLQVRVILHQSLQVITVLIVQVQLITEAQAPGRPEVTAHHVHLHDRATVLRHEAAEAAVELTVAAEVAEAVAELTAAVEAAEAVAEVTAVVHQEALAVLHLQEGEDNSELEKKKRG